MTCDLDSDHDFNTTIDASNFITVEEVSGDESFESEEPGEMTTGTTTVEIHHITASRLRVERALETQMTWSTVQKSPETQMTRTGNEDGAPYIQESNENICGQPAGNEQDQREAIPD